MQQRLFSQAFQKVESISALPETAMAKADGFKRKRTHIKRQKIRLIREMGVLNRRSGLEPARMRVGGDTVIEISTVAGSNGYAVGTRLAYKADVISDA